MQALIVDHAVSGGLRLGAAPDPVPRPNEVLVSVSAVSLNYGDIQDNVDNAPDGSVPGWEAAGVVVQEADDGSGPPVGTPVVSFGWTGGWAKLRAVDTAFLGVVPVEADLGAMATVPVAGVSALAALDRIGPLLGRRVLVTGATGGVGRYAVQLGRLGGAEVFAMTGDPARHGATLRTLGADAVVSSPAEVDGLLDGVVDAVGGRVLVEAFARLTRNGTLVAVGHVTQEAETFPVGALLSRPGQDNRSIATFLMPEATDVGRGMTWLAGRVAAGAVDPGIAWRGDWTSVAEAVELLRSRGLSGKAVLDLG